MAGLPAELVEQVRVLFGGIGLMALFAAWGVYKHITGNAKDTRARQDRLLQLLDESREKEMKSLQETNETLRRRADEDYRRYAAELSECRSDNKKLEDEIDRLREDRQEGWDRGRGMEQLAHDYRHVANNKLDAAFQAGRLYATPDHPRFGDETLRPVPLPLVPPLRDVERRSPTDNTQYDKRY